MVARKRRIQGANDIGMDVGRGIIINVGLGKPPVTLTRPTSRDMKRAFSSLDRPYSKEGLEDMHDRFN